jgi:ribosomal protein S10
MATAKKSTTATEEGGKLRIRIRAYEHKLLDACIKHIMDIEALTNLSLPSGVNIDVKMS